MNYHQSSKDLPGISIVIPSYRRIDRVLQITPEYLRQNADEIIIVLDGPHDDAGRLGELRLNKRVTIVELPQNKGLALARIEGLRRAKHEIILMADDDVMPGQSVVIEHKHYHSTTPRSVLVGYMPVLLPPRRERDQCPTYLYAREYENETAAWEQNPTELLFGLWNGNVSLPRSLYEEAEELNPSIRIEYHEDLDLGIRLAKIGATASFRRNAAAKHLHVRGLEGFLRESRARGRALRVLQERWGTLPPAAQDLVTLGRPGKLFPDTLLRLLLALPPSLSSNFLISCYRAADIARFWSIQDVSARILRRLLAIQEYRRGM